MGFDINKDRIEELGRGYDRTLEVDEANLKSSSNLSFSCDKADLKSCNIFIVTVPTPVDEHKRPDLTPLVKASETVGTALKKGDIVIYESTVYPGCTEEECVPVLEKISNSMDASLATDVLKEAIANYGVPKIFNSDQGSQYTSHEHTQILKDNGIQISMNGKGRSIDNITIERFFRTLKHSNIYIGDYGSINELKEGVKNYIQKYNFKRFHSSIGYKQPMNYYLEMVKKAA